MDKVLIVDDDMTLCNMFKSYLEDNNYLCITAHSGEIALKWLEEIKPELVIIDIGLPDINGIELTKKIRNNIKTKKVPVIILTGQGNTDYKIKSSVDAKASLFLEKPVDLNEMLKAVERLVKNYKEEKFKNINFLFT